MFTELVRIAMTLDGSEFWQPTLSEEIAQSTAYQHLWRDLTKRISFLQLSPGKYFYRKGFS